MASDFCRKKIHKNIIFRHPENLFHSFIAMASGFCKRNRRNHETMQYFCYKLITLLPLKYKDMKKV